MSFFTEFVSLPIDWNTLLYGAGLAAGATGLASVFTHEHPTEAVDLNAIKNRVAELEKSANRSLEQNDELAGLYTTWATELYDEAADLDEIVALFAKAEALLQATLAQGDDTVARQQLGNVYLNWAVTLNDYDDLPAAIICYLNGIDTLKPLDDSGDGDAKFDIAGMRLNLGIAYHELGDYERAKDSLQESLVAYRAVEKIGVAETRFFMAKVSVQQGHLLSDMGEPLDAIVDAHNRAMRLFVEVIEDLQEFRLERDLANVLLDRCVAFYEDWLEREFESAEAKSQKITDILVDVGRGVELLDKQTKEGNELARFDLFHGLVFYGKVLCDTEKYAEANTILDRAISEFTDLCEDEEDDMFLMQMAMAYASRAVVQLGLGKKDLSQQDCQKGSELINKLLQSEDGDDEDIQALKEQFQAMHEQLKK